MACWHDAEETQWGRFDNQRDESGVDLMVEQKGHVLFVLNDGAGLMVLGICRRGQVRRECNQQCISSNFEVIFKLTPWSSHRF